MTHSALIEDETWDARAFLAHREPPDYCSREGALALKEKIESYWRARGREVAVSLQNVGFHPAIRAARYDLRTDMVNGFPRQTLSAEKQGQTSPHH